MSKEEALKLALEALERFEGNKKLWPEAITAIKEALAQTQEPVAWVQNVEFEQLPEFAFSWVETSLHNVPLYTTPPQRTWVGLTDDEMTHAKHHMVEGAYQYSFKQGALWAEAKLKELNT